MKLSSLAKASLIVNTAAMSFSGISHGVNAEYSEFT